MLMSDPVNDDCAFATCNTTALDAAAPMHFIVMSYTPGAGENVNVAEYPLPVWFTWLVPRTALFAIHVTVPDGG